MSLSFSLPIVATSVEKVSEEPCLEETWNPITVPVEANEGLPRRRSRGLRLWQLLRKYPLRPWKRLSDTLHLALNLPSHFRIQSCLRRMDLSAQCAATPELAYKYLSNYLSPDFSAKKRAAILIFHYNFLEKCRSIHFRKIMSGGKQEIWSSTMEGKRYAIVYESPGASFREGDLAMVFTRQGAPIYSFCFSIIPGPAIGVAEHAVLFVGGSQGARGAQREIRETSKAFGEICPASLLFLQLKALAQSMGIRTIMATSTSGHTCHNVTKGKVNATSAYDGFWEAYGGIRIGRYYSFPSELVFRPSVAGSVSHRARSRRKQERKARLFLEMLAQFKHESTPSLNSIYGTAVSTSMAPV